MNKMIGLLDRDWSIPVEQHQVDLSSQSGATPELSAKKR
jgi:hypothetical protein